MTFAIAGLDRLGRRRPSHGAASAAISVSRFFDELERVPIMSKRVVLIGHPVAHSLSGAMQQAAFDAAGHRRDATSSGTGRRSRWPTRSRRFAATTSSAPTSRSPTRSGSSRSSTA